MAIISTEIRNIKISNQSLNWDLRSVIDYFIGKVKSHFIRAIYA